MNLNNKIITMDKIFFKVSVFSWKNEGPDVLTFCHMSKSEMNAWIDNLLSNPFSDITHVVLEEFKVADYE